MESKQASRSTSNIYQLVDNESRDLLKKVHELQNDIKCLHSERDSFESQRKENMSQPCTMPSSLSSQSDTIGNSQDPFSDYSVGQEICYAKSDSYEHPNRKKTSLKRPFDVAFNDSFEDSPLMDSYEQTQDSRASKLSQNSSGYYSEEASQSLLSTSSQSILSQRRALIQVAPQAQCFEEEFNEIEEGCGLDCHLFKRGTQTRRRHVIYHLLMEFEEEISSKVVAFEKILKERTLQDPEGKWSDKLEKGNVKMEGDDAIVMINRSRWENISYSGKDGVQRSETDKPKMLSIHLKKARQLLFLINQIKENLKEGKSRTMRDLYYVTKGNQSSSESQFDEKEQHSSSTSTVMFDSQKQCDNLVADLAALIKVPRHWFGLVTSTKGLVFGDLKFRIEKDGDPVDALENPKGTPIPTQLDYLEILDTSAAFILIVEKDAIFQKCVSSKVCQKLKCILITAKGYPDFNTRYFTRSIFNKHQLPILGLIDANPHGVEIMCCYRFGSLSLSDYEGVNSINLPFLRWLGLTPTCIDTFGINDKGIQPMTDDDRSKLKSIKKRCYFQSTDNNEEREHLYCSKAWKEEIDKMEAKDVKAELEALDLANGTDYLCKYYLPIHIKYGLWI